MDLTGWNRPSAAIGSLLNRQRLTQLCVCSFGVPIVSRSRSRLQPNRYRANIAQWFSSTKKTSDDHNWLQVVHTVHNHPSLDPPRFTSRCRNCTGKHAWQTKTISLCDFCGNFRPRVDNTIFALLACHSPTYVRAGSARAGIHSDHENGYPPTRVRHPLWQQQNCKHSGITSWINILRHWPRTELSTATPHTHRYRLQPSGSVHQ